MNTGALLALNVDIAISWVVCALCFFRDDESLGKLNYGKDNLTILYNLYNEGEDVRNNHFRRGEGVEKDEERDFDEILEF